LSNKLVIWAFCIIVFLTLFSTVSSLLVVYRQNLGSSEDLLRRSMKIIKEDIGLTQKKLTVNSRQLSIADSMGTKINFISEQKAENADINVLKTFITEMIQAVYNITLLGNLSKVAVYDKNGDLTAFVTITGDEASIGYPYPKKGIFSQSFKIGKMPVLKEDKYWKKIDHADNFDLKYPHKIPKSQLIQFESQGNFITLASYVPITMQDYDVDNDKEIVVQVGFIIASQRFGQDFVDKISNLTDTEINIFTGQDLSVGKSDAYKRLELDKDAFEQAADGFQNQVIVLNEKELNKKNYLQATLPVYKGSEYAGAITSLYSTDIALSNTWEVLSLLLLIALGAIILILPITLFFSKSLTRPLEELQKTISGVEKSGHFESRVKIRSRDEIGRTGDAFNSLMDSMQLAINDLNGVMKSVADSDLSKEITNDFKGDLDKLKDRTNRSLEMLSQTVIQII